MGAVSALFLSGRTAFSWPDFAGSGRDFEMLIVGDSLIAGQGLKEKDKFYTLTKNWLEKEVFENKRRVNLKNKSHSGAKLFLAENEIKALQDAEKDLDEFYHPEVNFSFPSTKTQIDVAAEEYKREGKSLKDIKLIMLSGGLTNINSSDIINPFKKNKTLRGKIEKYCNQAMFDFLNHAHQTFPEALLTVIGYFPMVSKKSSTGKIYNAILELYELPRPAKPIFNNIVTKQFIKPLHKKMSKRSKIWFEESTKALQTAVTRFNKKTGKEKALFVRSPIPEERSFGTKNSLLFGMAKKGRTNDHMYNVRKKVCGETIKTLKDVELKFKTRFCELAGIGHPNIEGSKAYAEAIREQLSLLIDQ
jgi:hypothetical protein